MARKQTPESGRPVRDWKTPLRNATLSISLLGCAVLAIYCVHRADEFLSAHPRFRFAGPPASGEPSPSLRVEGVVHASPDRVLRVFSADFGRSVQVLPIAERRRNLLAIDWVKDAIISRQWPDRLVVRIQERTPVAFVQLPAGGGSHRTALIDEDGVILDPPRRARFSLPVLTGIRADQPESSRRERVRLAMRLVREIGSAAEEISEIDVSDTENLKLTRQIEGNAVVLWMGNRNFLSRLRSLLTHWPEIRRRLPQATTFDLRLDNRITAVEGPRAAASGGGSADAVEGNGVG